MLVKSIFYSFAVGASLDQFHPFSVPTFVHELPMFLLTEGHTEFDVDQEYIHIPHWFSEADSSGRCKPFENMNIFLILW